MSRLRISALMLAFLAGCGDEEGERLVARIALDLSPCLAVPAEGRDYLCQPALATRVVEQQGGACLALQVQPRKGEVPPPQVLPLSLATEPDGGWVLVPLDPLSVVVSEGDVAQLRLFVLQPGSSPAEQCDRYTVETSCVGEPSCLLAFARAETPVSGDGALVLEYGARGRACGIECNDACQPEDGQCRRICYDASHPATELCDGLDNDCDGQVDDGFFLGESCPGVGECGDGVYECDDRDPTHHEIRCSTLPGGSAYVAADPAREEICDGLDNDCDGGVDNDTTDEGPDHPCGEARGECRQGYYLCDGGRLSCTNIEQGPVAEICDGLDNDCDGETDEDFAFEEQPIGTPCTGPGECGEGAVSCHKDEPLLPACCSADPECGWVGPETEEICDGLDNDCNGQTDEVFIIRDAVGVERHIGEACVGRGVCDDEGEVVCDGEQAAICSTMPGGPADLSGPELCDRLDNDCDGQIDEDFSWLQPAIGMTPAGQLPIGAICELPGKCGKGVVECDARDVARLKTLCSSGPGGSGDNSEPEICDGLDDDCDGVIPASERDNDGDRFPSCGDEPDCNDADATIHPRATELCNRKDDDCDGSVDEGNPQGGGPCGSDIGECTAGTERCVAGAIVCQGEVKGSAELCNGKDDDCDGQTDEDFTFAQAAIGDTPAGVLGVGQLCEVPGRCGLGLVECDPTDAARRRTLCSSGPGGSRDRAIDEVCNDVDDDCDGAVDEPFNLGQVCDPPGQCTRGVLECATSTTTRCSTGPGGSASQVEPEICDGLDNDCDGTVDDGYGVNNACDPPGVCPVGKLECRADHLGTVCSTGPGGSAYPVPAPSEDCNQLDDDCDGDIDEGVINPCGDCGVDALCSDTVCGTGFEACANIGHGFEDLCEPPIRLVSEADFRGCISSFQRDSLATLVIDQAGVLDQVAEHQPRFQYDPLLGQRVYLQEEAGSNLLQWSSELQTAPWTPYGAGTVVTLTSERGSPLDPAAGMASKVQSNNAGAVYQDLLRPVAGKTFAVSFWARKGTLDKFRVDGDGHAYLPAVTLTDTWQRFSAVITMAANAPDKIRVLFRNNTGGAGSFYLWGVQLEEARFASSYIPSGGAPGQRAAERLAVKPAGLRKLAGTWTAWIHPTAEMAALVGTVPVMEVDQVVKVEYLYEAGQPSARLRCTAPTNRTAELLVDLASWGPASWVLVGCAWDDAPSTATPGVQLFFWRSGEAVRTAAQNVALDITGAPTFVRLTPSYAVSRDVRLYQRRLSLEEIVGIRDKTRQEYGM
ncbi:MAG: MopE-related protein [Myxococcota bacterium]|jgi:hypothetical protein|nr:MopE-related protein [Myxococcota bacterium]